MKKYIQGTKFTVCSEAELIKKGWDLRKGDMIIIHPYLFSDEFDELSISCNQLKAHEGKTLTVDYESALFPDWYWVQENCFRWPVATFMQTHLNHQCIEGMTPLDGWFICKTCGDNLREIK